jgi:hypothetical protein
MQGAAARAATKIAQVCPTIPFLRSMLIMKLPNLFYFVATIRLSNRRWHIFGVLIAQKYPYALLVSSAFQ